MRNALVIGHNELRLFLERPARWIWLFAVPLAFVVAISMASRGEGPPGNRRPPVLIENLDTGFLGAMFIGELEAQGLSRLEPAEGATAARGVRVPADFTARVLEGRRATVHFFTVEGSGSADAALIEARLVRALIAFDSHLMEAITSGGGSATITEGAMASIRERPDRVTLSATFAGRRPVPTGFNFSLPATLTMYLMMNLLIFGGTSVAGARRDGTLRRISTLPVRRGELISGQIYGLVLLGVVQIVVFLLAGRLVFGVNLGANLPGVVLVLLTLTWVGAALGVFVGSIFNSPDRVAGVCVLASLLMAAVGGCWWPLEVAPAWAQGLARTVPTGWALQALHRLISFGGDVESVLLPLGVLAGFALAATVAAARWFRV